jgi:hypothetical protein
MNPGKSYIRIIRFIGVFWLLYGIAYIINKALCCWAWTAEIDWWIVHIQIGEYIIENTLPALAVTIMGAAIVIYAQKLFTNLREIRHKRGLGASIFLFITSILWTAVGIYLIPDTIKSFLYVKPYNIRLIGWLLSDIDSLAGIWIYEYFYPILLIICGLVLFFFIMKYNFIKTKIQEQIIDKLHNLSLIQIAGYLWIASGLVLIGRLIYWAYIQSGPFRIYDSGARYLYADWHSYLHPSFYIITGIALLIMGIGIASKKRGTKTALP